MMLLPGKRQVVIPEMCRICDGFGKKKQKKYNSPSSSGDFFIVCSSFPSRKQGSKDHFEKKIENEIQESKGHSSNSAAHRQFYQSIFYMKGLVRPKSMCSQGYLNKKNPRD